MRHFVRRTCNSVQMAEVQRASELINRELWKKLAVNEEFIFNLMSAVCHARLVC